MNNIITKDFNGNVITFDLTNDIMINLTEMAKANNKQVYEWTRLDSTKSYLSKLEGIDLTNFKPAQFPCLKNIIIKQGNMGGTWASKRVAIRFAQWLSDDFAIWVDTQIEELLTKGSVSIQHQIPQTYSEALQLAANQAKLLEEQKPLVEFANNVANTASSITIHGFAAILSKDKINIGEKRLFQWFRDNGYLTKNNIVTQYAKDGGWLKTIEKTRVCAKTNSIVPYAQTLVTGKGQLFFAKKLMNEFNNKDK